MASDSIQGSLKGTTLTITGLVDKKKNTVDIDFSANGSDTALLGASGVFSAYGSDITKIESTYAKGINLITYKKLGTDDDAQNSKLEEVTLGKGADTILARHDLTITTGAGKDLILVDTDTGTLTLTDFDAKNDIIQLGTGVTALAGTSIIGTAANSKNVELTIDGSDHKLILKDAVGKKITVKNGTGTIIYEDTTANGDDKLKTVTDSSAGASISSGSNYIDASGRKKALTITATKTTGTQIIAGGAAADSIHAAKVDTTITGGKGADVFYIDSSTSAYTVTIDDYTPGDAKTADKIFLGDGLYFATDTSAAYNDDGSLTFALTTNADGSTGTDNVTLKLGTGASWNQVKPVESKAQVWFTNKADLGTIAGSAAYANPKEVVITDKNVNFKKLGVIDIQATIEAAAASGKDTDKTFQISTANRAIDTSTAVTNIINFSNISGPINVITKNALHIVGSKGKDTITGSDSAGATLNGFSGNDLIIAHDGDSGVGGVGNDTLRGKGADAHLYGGAGNDVFVLSPEGSTNTFIEDYYSGRADAIIADKAGVTAAKKALGSDKLVVSNDKVNAKGAVARASLTGGQLGTAASKDMKQSDITLSVSGQMWVEGGNQYVTDTWTAWAYNGTLPAYEANSTATVYAGGHFEDGDDSTFTIKDALGKAVTLVDQGTTYQQTVSAATSITTAQSFHGALSPEAVIIDASGATKKAVKVVAGSKTTSILGGAKNDTLVGNDDTRDVTVDGQIKEIYKVTLTGGNGNDVFVGGGYITDLNTGKDKLVVDSFSRANFGGVGNTDTGRVQLGGFDFAMGTAAVTFTHTEVTGYKYSKPSTKDGSFKITEVTTTDQMIRGFGTSSSVVSFGKGSTKAYVYGNSDLDSGVAVLDASKTGKNTEIVNNGKYVQSIVGSAKNDTIYAGLFGTFNDDGDYVKPDGNAKYYGGKTISDTAVWNSTLVTVATGKGNDVIEVSGSAYVTDFTASKVSKGKVSGDALLFSGGYVSETGGDDDDDVTAVFASDVTVASSKLLDEYVDGRKVQGSGNLKITFDGSDVQIGGIKLKGMKDKTAYIYTNTDKLNTALGELATLKNLAAYTAVAADKGKTLTGSLGMNTANGISEEDVYIIDAAAVTKGAIIDGGKYITEITGSKGVDTIYAGWGWKPKSGDGTNPSASTDSGTTIAAGAGADYIVFDANSISNSTYTISDYAADKIYLNGLTIQQGTIGPSSGDAVTVKSGKVNYYTSDVTLTLTDSTGTKGTIKLVGQTAANGYKVTQVDSVSAKANSFALTYGASDVTVGAADGNVINLTGAGLDSKLNVNIDAKRSKAVTLVGGKSGTATTIFGTGGKAAITYISGGANHTDTDVKATFYGGSKNDIYVGGGASDVVVFSAGGNNTVLGGGQKKSSITFGTGKDVAVVKASDTFILNSYSAGNDVIVLDSVYGASALESANYDDANKTLKLTFGGTDWAENASVASVTFGSYAKGDKITVKLSSANSKGALVQGATVFQLGFGTDVSYADADGTTINAQFVADATKIAAADSKVKKAHLLTVGTNSTTKVAEMIGGAGNDTLVANYGVVKLTGDKGNDTFEINSETNITITDFNTGKDTIKFGTGAVASDFLSGLKAYSSKYDMDTSANTITLHYGKSESASDLTLANATATNLIKSGVSTAIDIGGTKYTLYDKVNVVLAKGVAVDGTSDFSSTKTFDGSKSTSGLSGLQFGTALTTFKGTTQGDTINFDSTATIAVTFTGGADTYNHADKVTLSLGNSKWSISGAASDATTKHVKLTVWESKSKSETIDLNADADTFTLGTSAAYKDETSGSKKGGTDTDSDTMTYTWKKDLTISGKGFSNVVYSTVSSTNKSADSGAATWASAFEEKYESMYEPITAAETLFGATALEDISPTKAAVDVDSTAKAEVDYGTGGVITASSVLDKTKANK